MMADDGARAAVVVGVDALALGGGEQPDVAIVPVLAPARLIGMHHGSLPHLRANLRNGGRPPLRHPIQEVDNLAHTDAQAVPIGQIALDHADGQAQGRAQVGDERGNADSQAALAQHLLTQVQLGLVPPVACRTPPVVDAVLAHDDGGRRRQLDHLALPTDMHPAQSAATVRTLRDAMLDHLGRLGFAPPGVVVFSRPLLAWGLGHSPFAHVLRTLAFTKLGGGVFLASSSAIRCSATASCSRRRVFSACRAA